MNDINKQFLNDVKERFLPLPRNATEELEHELNISDFEIKKDLGFGSYGKVCLVKYKKTKQEYALKIINKLDQINQEEKTYFNREIEIMYKLNHPNIIKLYSHFEDNKNCYFLMQYVPNGTAYELIPKNGKKQENLKLVASIIKDIIKAIYYLHNMNPKIIHRDIKPENILLDENNNAYLIDFGWSNYIRNNRRRNSICGSPFYLSPEMVNETGHDEKNDIWGVGVLLFELVTGKVPFEGNNIEEVRKNIISFNMQYPTDINPDAKDLILKLLKKIPSERMDEEKILNHKFIKQFYPNAVNELIKPDKISRKIFVVSKDDPKTWNIPTTKQPSNNNKQNFQIINIIKKTNTMDNYKFKCELSPIKKKISNDIIKKIDEKVKFISYITNYGNYKNYNKNNNNKNNNNNNTNNTNSTNTLNIYKTNFSHNNNNSNIIIKNTNNIIKNSLNNIASINNINHSQYISKYKSKMDNNYSYYSNTIKYNENKNKSANNSNNKFNYGRKYNNINYNSPKTHRNYYIKSINACNINGNEKQSKKKYETDRYSILSKRYDSLKNEYELWKNKELEKLRKELKDIDTKISQAIKQTKSCDLLYEINKKKNDMKNLTKLYENLKIENKKLKGKIKNYSNYFKNNDINYLKNRNNTDVLISNDIINDIIKGKEKEVNDCKEQIKINRQKEKERFAILINKYDRTLISKERENFLLKKKLKELERKFY